MGKRKYKIVEESRPSDSFTRWIPMLMEIKNDEYGMECQSEWTSLPYGIIAEQGYTKTKKEAESQIDKYENFRLEHEGHFIINETEYNPDKK